ncbi:hypothetical protein VZC37_06465 [Gordonia sp. LSe1-13]|uniref:DUF2567 domain-containing protein n=1 Tax=Gordonia sesuvii TaxID=3116777 RepID=A0ABU7MAU5_9ACTN|nr:hypothetical protein [Gordonia sp. LSe1-13]
MLNDPPPRPPVEITPMRAEEPRREGATGLVIGLWAVALVLVAATTALIVVHLSEVREVLALDLARDQPDAAPDEVVRAVNIAFGAGALLVAVIVVAAVYGCIRLWEATRSGRGWMVLAVVAAVAATIGEAIVIGPSSAAVADAGVPVMFQWPVAAVGAAFGGISTAIAYRIGRTGHRSGVA